MEAPSVTEIPGTAPDLAEALAAAGLPIDDLAEPGRRFFRFADALGPIGFIGWEATGEAALLRSLVVVPARRGQGWSPVLLDWALKRMAEDNIGDAWLLTTTIPDLAAKAGFAPVARDRAPPVIRDSRQFRGLCPATAILMQRSLP